jgi:SAM-dependent methyltransferase
LKEEFTLFKYSRFTVIAVLLASCALVLCAVQGIFGYPFRKTIALDPAKFIPVEGFAYSAPLLAQYSPWGAQSASARLYEDTRVSFLYSQQATSVSEIGKGIFSFPKKGRLFFSASDNSDPRINGRNYRIEVPHRLSKGVLPLCFIAWLMTVTIHLLTSPEREKALLAWRERAGFVLGAVVRRVGTWPAIALSIPSIYLLLFYPPLWKDVDALGQLTAPASVLNILHNPPLYCFFARLPFLITSWIANIWMNRSLYGVFEQQQPSLEGIYLLVIVQHIALISALTYTIVSLTSNRSLRFVFALALASFSSLYTHAHCCGSEALSIPATFVLLAAGTSIVRGFSLSAWIVSGTAMILAIGSRHLNVIFAAWLPVALICVGLVTKFGWCSPNAEAFHCGRTIGAAVLVGAIAIGLNDWMAKSMIAAFHDEYRSTLGWTLSDRVQSFLDRLPSTERLQLARDLSTKVSDPQVRLAIEAHARVGSFYQGTGQVIAEELVRSGVPPTKIGAERDRIILAATESYLMTAHPILIRTIWEDFLLGLFYADNSKIARAPFFENRDGAIDKMKHPERWKQLEALPSLGMIEAIIILDAACRDPYINLGRNFPLVVLMICTLLAGWAACVTHGELPKKALFGWCALASGILLFFTCMLGVFYLDRYTIPLLITTVFALLASLASLWQPAAESIADTVTKSIKDEKRRYAFRVWLESRFISRLPDRELLLGRILPELSKPGITMLWVGCQPYTRPYLEMIERPGAKCWTLDIDPSARWWGHSRRHIVGDLQRVGTLYLPHQFDVALVNGVFGYGLNTQDGQSEAIMGLARVLKPGGLLMLGWNTHRASDPLRLPAIERFFIRSRRPRFDQRITFPESTHVYDFFELSQSR